MEPEIIEEGAENAEEQKEERKDKLMIYFKERGWGPLGSFLFHARIFHMTKTVS